MSTKAHTVSEFFLNGFVDPCCPEKYDPWLWVGDLKSGEIKKRSPKKRSIVPGYYDGNRRAPGAGITFEAYLQKIESVAAPSLRSFLARPLAQRGGLPPDVLWFLAWQAARTPAMRARFRTWIASTNPDPNVQKQVDSASGDDFLHSADLQARYFRDYAFPRLAWTCLDASPGHWFVTSDRAVAWIDRGSSARPLGASPHPRVQFIAPLSRSVAVIGQVGPLDLTDVSAADVNHVVAELGSDWIAGPSQEVVAEAMKRRR